MICNCWLLYARILRSVFILVRLIPLKGMIKWKSHETFGHATVVAMPSHSEHGCPGVARTLYRLIQSQQSRPGWCIVKISHSLGIHTNGVRTIDKPVDPKLLATSRVGLDLCLITQYYVWYMCGRHPDPLPAVWDASQSLSRWVWHPLLYPYMSESYHAKPPLVLFNWF